jgi:hypothetical protein
MKGSFINATEISWLSIDDGVIRFATHGCLDGSYQVAKNYENDFLNQVQAINQNHPANVQAAWLNKTTNTEYK